MRTMLSALAVLLAVAFGAAYVAGAVVYFVSAVSSNAERADESGLSLALALLQAAGWPLAMLVASLRALLIRLRCQLTDAPR